MFERRALLFSCFVDAELRYADAWFPGFAQRPSDYAERLVVVRAAASDAGRDPMAVMPAIWLFVVTGNTRDDVAETLSSDIAKLFALGVSGDVWERHGVPHPLGSGFSGSQDLVPQTLDAQSALSYAAKVPDSLLREALLTGTPGEVLEQAAHWRDHGARYVVVCNAGLLQPSLRKGLATSGPFGKVVRGLRKL